LANVRRALLGKSFTGRSARGGRSVPGRRRQKTARPDVANRPDFDPGGTGQPLPGRAVESTRGQIRIHDLKTFYAAIDDSIADLIDLIETWIWWDIRMRPNWSASSRNWGLSP